VEATYAHQEFEFMVNGPDPMPKINKKIIAMVEEWGKTVLSFKIELYKKRASKEDERITSRISPLFTAPFPEEVMDYFRNKKIAGNQVNVTLESNNLWMELGRWRRPWRNQVQSKTTTFHPSELLHILTRQSKARYPFTAQAGGGGMLERHKNKGYYGMVKLADAYFHELLGMEDFGYGTGPMRTDMYQSYGWLNAYAYADNTPYFTRSADWYLDATKDKVTKQARYDWIWRPVYTAKTNPPPRSRPFPWNKQLVQRSPLRSMKRAQRTLDSWKEGNAIGETASSSLKSMGKIPRGDGKYEVGYVAKNNPVFVIGEEGGNLDLRIVAPNRDPIMLEALRAATDKSFKHHKWYVKHHLDYVMAIAKAIVKSDEPEDQQLIHDMVWMHDYPKMMGDNDNFELVREVVSKHRDERYTIRLMNQLRWMEEIKSPDWSGRTTTIAAVMSTADALAHYHGPFFQIFMDENPDTPIAELKKMNKEKLERDKRKVRAGPKRKALDSIKFRYKGRKVRVVGNAHIAELIARKNPSQKFLDGEASTLVFVKPLGLNAWLDIKRMLPGAILRKQWVRVDKELISQHYAEHSQKPHFSRLVNYYEGQWVLALVVGARFDAVRAIIGSSKPDQLKEGDIRKAILDKYGDSSISLIEDWTNGVDNGIHASDSVEAANQELKLWFDRPVPPTPKFLNLSSHAAGAENDDNFHPFAGLTLPIGDWTKCAEVVVDFFEGLPWLPGWVRGKNTPPMIISGTAVLVALVLYTYRALIGKDPTIQGANPFGEDDFLPEEQRLILSRLVEDLRRRRPALANPKAPGYNSYAWTTPEDR
jgi:nucleoside-diphosphate kinase